MRLDLGLSPFVIGKLSVATVVEPIFDPVLDTVYGIADRGLPGTYPENTQVSFEAAAASGFKSLGTKLRLTSDRQWLAVNDTTFNRTSDGSGYVYDFTLAQAKQLDASNGFTGFGTPRFLTAREFLDICYEQGVVPNIEIADSDWVQAEVDSLTADIRASGVADRAVVGSYDLALLQAVVDSDPTIDLSLWSGSFPSEAVLDSMLPLKRPDNNLNWSGKTSRLTSTTTAYVRDRNISLSAWYATSTSNLDSLVPMGVTGFHTGDLPHSAFAPYNT